MPPCAASGLNIRERRIAVVLTIVLIVHGMVDDNVHPANAWQLANALQSKGRPFDMMLFPNSGHGIASPSYESVTWTHLLRGLGLAN